MSKKEGAQQRAVVIGGSLGGLFAANLLHAIGWHVDVYERVADDLATRGAGIGTHDELFSILRRLGIAVDASRRMRTELPRRSATAPRRAAICWWRPMAYVLACARKCFPKPSRATRAT